jgi:hypothetical protein
MKQSSKYKRLLKSLCIIIYSLLNQSLNKYSQEIIRRESCEESISYIFFTYHLETAQKNNSRVRIVHTLTSSKFRFSLQYLHVHTLSDLFPKIAMINGRHMLI